MEYLVKILYEISNALLVPDIVALFLLLAWSMLQVGGLVRELLDRRTGQAQLRALAEDVKLHGASNAGEILRNICGVRGPAGDFVNAIKRSSHDALVLGKVVDDVQVALSTRVSRPALGIRLGPMLGLMGTLIPMGPALTGLASGNVAELANNLVVAFSTTVLGIVIGGSCYLVATVRRRWYAQDLSDIEFLGELTIKTQLGIHDATGKNEQLVEATASSGGRA